MTELQLPKLIAHRGASKYAPENTLIALQKAQQLGASWVEFDARLTADNQAIIFHDDELDRVSDSYGSVFQTSFDVVQELEVGSWFSPEFDGEPIPTLKQWLQLSAQLDLGINLEMKVTKRRKIHKLAEQVVFALREFWPSAAVAPLVSSGVHECLAAVRQQDRGIMLGYITDTWHDNIFDILDRYQCVSLHVNHERLTAERVAQVHATGRKVLAYTVNDQAVAEQLFAIGVDSIFSDDPCLLN